MEKKRQTLPSGERFRTDESKGVSKARGDEKAINNVKKKDKGKTERFSRMQLQQSSQKVLYAAAVCLSRPSCVHIAANAIIHSK